MRIIVEELFDVPGANTREEAIAVIAKWQTDIAFKRACELTGEAELVASIVRQ